jgi:hypothetical protein
MIGGPGSGKPFIRQDDLTRSMATRSTSDMAPLGGPERRARATASATKKSSASSSFPVKIGRQWYGVGITDVAKEETSSAGSSTI